MPQYNRNDLEIAARNFINLLYLLTNTELINVFTGYVQTLDLFYMPSIC